MSKSVTRLFEQFHPENYNVTFAFQKNEKTFSGTVVIKGKKIGRPSKRITLHGRDLKVKRAKITKHNKEDAREIAISRVNVHKSFEEIRLHSDELLYPGAYTISLEFSGKITDPMNGIYPCYFEHDGKKDFLIATQFESHHARSAFPCIDEPEAKATFDITLQHSKNETALSNMPMISEQTKDDLTTTVFETTPKMSSYLVAFVIGNMHCEQSKTKDGTIVRSWATKAQPKKMLQYSVEEAVSVLEFFTDYFGTPYPLAKCDQVALPDFDAGAMENWGLITYREIVLLADPDNRSISAEQYVSLVVAHELSHQWFGNLVTMQWWDDLWLNESFASLMEHVALDAIHPDWHQWELYTSMDVISTTSRDIYKDIQPVVVKVTDPELIETLFDPGIVYAKGGRLLKMVREYIGDEAFRAGLKAYFKQHAYSNATRDDLWRSLSEASGRDLSSLMTPWIIQSGMPVVRINQNGKKIIVSQERYVLDADNDPTIWPIPLLADAPVEPAVVTKKTQTIISSDPDFRVINERTSGHYFVNYENADHRAFLAQKLSTQTLTTEGRIGLLNDTLMLAKRGDVSLVQALKLIAGLHEEPRDSVWAMIARIIGTAGALTEDHKATETAIKKLKVMLAKDNYKKLGWEDNNTDDANTKQLRHTMIAFMIAGEDAEALQTALAYYKKAKNIDALPAEIRSSILGVAVRKNKSTVDALLAGYPKASPELQLDITSALASTRDPKQASHILDSALGPKGFVRAQDLMRWLALFARNHYVRTEAWDYLEAHWDEIYETLSTSKSFDYLPVYFASGANTDSVAKRYEKFFTPKRSIKTLAKNIDVGAADINARLAWRKRDEKDIVDFFAS